MVSVNELDSERNSAINFACKNENITMEILEYLISKGATDLNGALRGICGNDEIKIEMVELLINKGASPNDRDSEGNFCINLASENRKVNNELFELLLKNGASSNSKGKYDRQPLHLICDQYNHE